MYKTQFKKNSPYESWQTAGTFGTETQAIQSAITKKNSGAVLVRVIDKEKKVVFTS